MVRWLSLGGQLRLAKVNVFGRESEKVPYCEWVNDISSAFIFDFQESLVLNIKPIKGAVRILIYYIMLLRFLILNWMEPSKARRNRLFNVR